MEHMASLAHWLVSRDDDDCAGSRCEKPIPTTRLALIVGLSLGGTILIGTLIVIFYLHKRRQRHDRKEDAADSLQLGEDTIIDDNDYAIQRPQASQRREPREYRYDDDQKPDPLQYQQHQQWEDAPDHGRSPAMPSTGRSPMLPHHDQQWTEQSYGRQ